MNSTIFTPEEARFLRLVLKLADRPHDDTRGSWMPCAADKVRAAGEFRILIMGAPGVGKTSLLKRFSTGHFPDPLTLPRSDYVHGCRRHITIDASTYTVDALELPADHLSSPEHLRQALAITEAAVLVYDIADPASLTYLKSLSSPIYEALHQRPKNATTTPTIKKRAGFPFSTASPTRAELAAHPSRPYHFLLVGTKTDLAQGATNGATVGSLEGQTAAGEFFGPGGVACGASSSFLEVSALTGDNVDLVFPLLGRQVLRSKRERRKREEDDSGLMMSSSSSSSLRRCGADGDCDCVDGRRPLRGSVWRRWYAFKASFSRGLGWKVGSDGM